jgi:hypothetical protein
MLCFLSFFKNGLKLHGDIERYFFRSLTREFVKEKTIFIKLHKLKLKNRNKSFVQNNLPDNFISNHIRGKNFIERNPALFGFLGSIIGAIITILTLYYTIRLSESNLKLSTDQFNYTKEQRTLDSTSNANKDTLSARQYNLRRSLDIKSDNRDSISLQAQIDALNETQKQFDIEHRPFIKIKIDTVLMVTSNVTFDYTLSDLTNMPVKIISSSSAIFAGPNVPVFDIRFLKNTNIIDEYLVKDTPIFGKLSFNIPINDEFIKLIRQRQIYWYVWGKIKYESLSSHKIYLYEYKMMVSYFANGNMYEKFLYNDNKELH